MYTCDECADRLLDYLYGLLEADEVQGLRAHLADCPACQAALHEAEAQQGLLARAAHVAQTVPAFVAPSDPPAETTSPAPAPAEPAAASPATIPLAPPKMRTPRRWPWLAVAASLLLLAGGLYWSYERGLERRQLAVTRAREEVQAVEAQFASAGRTYEQELAGLPAQVQARQLRLQVTGPVRYQPDAPSQVRVVTQDVHGAPTAAQVQVSVLDRAGKPLMPPHASTSAGETVLAVPAGLPVKSGESSQLVVTANQRGAVAELREDLVTAGPTFVTHVALSKPLYRVGEVVLLRTLTLDRFSLKPPGQEIPLSYTLRDARNMPVKQLKATTRPDGVASAEIPLNADLAAGDYTLLVTAANPENARNERLLPQTRRFTVVRSQPAAFAGAAQPSPQVEFERYLYYPGDKVRGVYNRNAPDAPGAANQTVKIQAQGPEGTPLSLNGAAAGMPLQTNTDAKGRASFELQLPKNIGPGQPVVEVEDPAAKQNARYRQAIPVAAAGAHPVVEFFPEGGDLVASVPNRVYFRARTPQGGPVDLKGRVVDRQGKEVARVQTATPAADATRPHGLGLFDFTPQPGEAYTLQISVSANTTAVLPLPPVHVAGVALSVPEAVGREGEAIRAVVRQVGSEQRLLVLATCRGHVVDQQFVSASPAGTEVRLSPVAGTRGVVRVTVCEVQPERLLPRAERLAYRLPAERLALSLAEAGKESGRVNLGFKASNEKNEPASAYFFAAVVDERALPPGGPAPQGLPAFFYLTSEINGGDDLENADFLVSDTPPARAALDLFLGTQGWRRFTESDAAPLLAEGAEPALAAAVADHLAVFSRDNFEEANAKGTVALARGRDELRRKALHERETLQEQRDLRAAAAGVAAAALRDYEELPRRYIRMAVGLIVLLLLAAGGMLLLFGFVRAVRGGRSTAVLASAFTSLLLCLVIYGVTGDLRQTDRGQADQAQQAQLSERALPRFDEAPPEAAAKPVENVPPRSGPVGRFTEVPERKRDLASPLSTTTQEALGKVAPQDQKSLERLSGRSDADRLGTMKEMPALPKGAATETAKGFGGGMQPTGRAPGPGGGVGGPPIPAPPAPTTMPRMSAGGVAPLFKKTTETPPPAEAKGTKDAESDTAKRILRQYAARDSQSVSGLPDVLLWCPVLTAPDGTARVAFDLSANVAAYRVLLYAHSPSGRLGAYQGKIQAR
jgi:hypothetical protein